jgi:hypothetical protein
MKALSFILRMAAAIVKLVGPVVALACRQLEVHPPDFYQPFFCIRFLQAFLQRLFADIQAANA